MEVIKQMADQLCRAFTGVVELHNSDDLQRTVDAVEQLLSKLPGAKAEQYDSGGGLKLVVALFEAPNGATVFATADDTSISVYDASKLGTDLTSCYEAWYELYGEDSHVLIASACVG